ncbi:MAG: type II secretion system F family protein [Planctomycetota bacterium]|nr:type II secretion system F family protein [Planctomycetota bacterium]
MYQYQMKGQGGGVTVGQIAAGSLAEAAAIVRNQGAGYLLEISPMKAGGKSLIERIRTFSVDFGPGIKDVFTFTNQLSVMIKAGIDVRGATESIAEQVENPRFRKILHTIRKDLEAGKPFSEALAKHPKVFSPLYINMVKASEMSGNFGHMLERISAYLHQQIETRSMIRGAMVYPIIIATMAISTTIFLLTFVLPKFTKLFAGKEDLLPMPTTMLLATSAFLRGYWYVVIAVVCALVVGGWYFIRTPFGCKWWDLAKLRLPLLKRIFRALYITRGLQTMGEMVNAGVPMLETLKITADVSGNTFFRQMWMAVHKSVKGGKQIAGPLSRYGLLPGNVVQMVSAGEESGRLADVLTDIAKYYAQELKNVIKAVTAMIEPLMIVLMGFLVGFIAMSIILPIFKMSQLVK